MTGRPERRPGGMRDTGWKGRPWLKRASSSATRSATAELMMSARLRIPLSGMLLARYVAAALARSSVSRSKFTVRCTRRPPPGDLPVALPSSGEVVVSSGDWITMPLHGGLARVVRCDAAHLSTDRYDLIHPIAVHVLTSSGPKRAGKAERRSVMSRTARHRRLRGRVNLRFYWGERVVCLPVWDSRDR